MSSDWFNSLLSEESYLYVYLDKGSGLQKKKVNAADMNDTSLKRQTFSV